MKLYLAMQRDNDYEGSDHEVGIFDNVEAAQAACNELHADEKDELLEWEESQNEDDSYHVWNACATWCYSYEIMLVDVNKRLMHTNAEWQAIQAKQHASYEAKYTDEQRAEDERIILEYEARLGALLTKQVIYWRSTLPKWFIVKD